MAPEIVREISSRGIDSELITASLFDETGLELGAIGVGALGRAGLPGVGRGGRVRGEIGFEEAEGIAADKAPPTVAADEAPLTVAGEVPPSSFEEPRLESIWRGETRGEGRGDCRGVAGLLPGREVDVDVGTRFAAV